MSLWLALFGILGIIAALLYWQLIIAEGTYLGQRAVTWLYNLAATRYDSIKGFDDAMEDLFLGGPIASMLHDDPSALVLDVGTGTGRLPTTLLRQPGFRGRIIGIDDSVKMLVGAAQKLKPYGDRLWLMHRSAMNLPFADSSFDLVAALEMLEFTPDPPTVLREIVRVLVPGGYLVTTRRRGRDARFIPGKTYSTDALSALLLSIGITEIRIESWQMDYDLVWGRRSGQWDTDNPEFMHIFLCPQCEQARLSRKNQEVLCGSCGFVIPRVEGILDMV